MREIEPYTGDLIGRAGWLSPDGKFFMCLYTEHIELANQLVYIFNYNIIRKYIFIIDGEKTLEENNWVKISLKTFQFGGKRISDYQWRFLKRYAEKNDIVRYYEDFMNRYYQEKY